VRHLVRASFRRCFELPILVFFVAKKLRVTCVRAWRFVISDLHCLIAWPTGNFQFVRARSAKTVSGSAPALRKISAMLAAIRANFLIIQNGKQFAILIPAFAANELAKSEQHAHALPAIVIARNPLHRFCDPIAIPNCAMRLGSRITEAGATVGLKPAGMIIASWKRRSIVLRQPRLTP
jgi:hypothetical protein